MLKSKTFVKRTKKGNVVKVVKEHYLRDDIGTGVGTVLQAGAECYVIPDTNVILHQITVMENPVITNVIVLQTVLDEVKNQNASIYNRLRALVGMQNKHFYVFSNEHHKETYVERIASESPNDRNDRAIRVAALWYMRKLSESKPVLLLTNDRANMEKAKFEEINVKTIQQYVRNDMKQHPQLLEFLNNSDELEEDAEVNKSQRKTKGVLFQEHKSEAEIRRGLLSKTYITGKLIVNRNNINEATITPDHGDKILIKGFENINRAINGDIVAVELLPRDQWTTPSTRIAQEQSVSSSSKDDHEVGDKIPTGRVVGITKKNWRMYCGSLDESTNDPKDGLVMRVLFSPVDRSIPKIRISTRQCLSLMNKRITVSIDEWKSDSKFPDGHYMSTLGDIYNTDVESRVILLEHDIPHYTFSENILNCLPQEDWKATVPAPNRVDLRDEYVMSVDPPGCTDIDDALHCKPLPNGNYQIGVHIADVTHFVHEGSPLDDEAAKRGTTVYLVDRRIEMLPKLLTNNLCSLVSDVDRYAFSVIWEVDQDAQIIDVRFCKSVIRSRHSLTYEQAQNIIDDTNRDDLPAQALRNLLKFSKLIKNRRREAGSLSLASPQVKFDIDRESMNPTDVEMYQMRETNSLVEEYMLLANVSVAKKILHEFPTLACLRGHPRPAPEKFDQLLKTLSTVDVQLDTTSSKALNDSLNAIDHSADEYVDTLVRILVTRCMEQAIYLVSGDHEPDAYVHYGLAAPLYTHFTSPIRRYADVIVHRLLACSLGLYPLSKRLTDRELARTIVDGLNKRNRMAQYSERASVELYTNTFFANRLVECEDAYVVRVRSNGLILFVPRYGFEHNVKILEESCQYDDAGEYMVLRDTIKIKTFQRVGVKIFVNRGKNYRRRLVMQVVEPDIMFAMDTKDLTANMLMSGTDDDKRKEDVTDVTGDVTLFEKSSDAASEPKNKKKKRTK
ncbi:nuclear exosome complex RNAse Dis3/RPR44 [Acrasis kona]|uniref:Ribosomal RNA-processing protein 44 n=1 Tax=Acrasis kona TaxID=1008807 RepID=A0AAW2Z458_9EUKA